MRPGTNLSCIENLSIIVVQPTSIVVRGELLDQNVQDGIERIIRLAGADVQTPLSRGVLTHSPV